MQVLGKENEVIFGELQDLLVGWVFWFYGILMQCCQILRHLSCHFISSVVQQNIGTLFHKLGRLKPGKH